MLGALLALAVPAAAQTGSFEVTAAPRSPVVTAAQARNRPDDPRLVGRLVTLGAVPTFDGAPLRCDRPRVVRARTTAGQLIRALFPDQVNYGRRQVARPADFGLALAPGARVSVTWVRCAAARGPRPFYPVAALFAIAPGRRALWLADASDNLLILKPATGPIRASFDCARAGSTAERTICADRLLAGWDRSVAAAYATGDGDVAEQRAWLAERDRCGADKACLHQSMSLRTFNLLH